MKKPEILAPAGNKESLMAAIAAGCDAVYLGGHMFGARSFAGNFSNEELINAINFAHLHKVRVYVTTNTLIYENETDEFMEYIDFLHKNNVDAIIIQDIGMLDLVRKTYPNLEIHASTQMHIHNLEGVKLCKKLGIKRCVIARETPIELIKEIKDSIDMEIEVFVHGALCISYSGQCLMSSMIGGRSGNRGTCAQCCRQPYDLVHNGEKVSTGSYLLSAKDLNTIESIGRLMEIGVDSFKIEGRMKRPEYVYLITSLYKKAINNYIETGHTNISNKDITEMKKLFNREFTRGFLLNEKNRNFVNMKRPNHMGIEIGKIIHRDNKSVKIKLINEVTLNDGIRIISDPEDIGCNLTKIMVNKISVNNAISGEIIEIDIINDVSIGDIVVKTTDSKQLEDLNNLIINHNQKIELSGTIVIKENEKIKLEINDGEHIIKVISNNVVEHAINAPTEMANVLKQISKVQEAGYRLNNLTIDLDDNLFVPVQVLNDLRRDAIAQLNEKRLYKSAYKKEAYNIEVPNFDITRNINILIYDEHQYNKIKHSKFNEIYMEEHLYKMINDDRRILKAPRVIERHEEYEGTLLVGELGSVNKYNNVYTDFSLNVTNSYTVALLHSLGVNKVTLSYELSDDQIKDIVMWYKKRYEKHPNLEVIIYGKEELMITKFDLLDCYDIRDNAYLVDRFNNGYPIYNEGEFMHIYNYKPRRLNKKEFYYDLGINNVRVNLLDETVFDINII